MTVSATESGAAQRQLLLPKERRLAHTLDFVMVKAC